MGAAPPPPPPNKPHERELPDGAPRHPDRAPRPPHAYGPVHRSGAHRYRRDTGSAWMGNVIFFAGSVFGMGLMLLILYLWPPPEDPDVAHYREVRDFVQENFVEDVDRGTLLQSALRGMMDELDDYSEYYVEGETVQVRRETSGHFVGIGVVFRNGEVPGDHGRVLFPISDSPAAEAGVRVGDQILSIDGQSVEGLSDEAFEELLQGEVGSVARLQVRGRDGDLRDHEVTRRDMVDPSVRRIEIIDQARKIGYLAIHSFSNETAWEFDQAFEALQAKEMRGLVIDLRGNQGGVLSAAVAIARRFVAQGMITSTEGRGSPVSEKADPEDAHYIGFPLVLLVDHWSASSSEVLAGALQDHRAAVLIGRPTWGKGMVQTISRYPAHDAIAKVTSSYFYTPAHRNLERLVGGNSDHGLEPDIEIELEDDEVRAIYRYVKAIPPPVEALGALRAWEEAEGIELITDRPPDPHLDAAITLFSGRNPLVEEEREPE